jgi:hypothetical protein
MTDSTNNSFEEQWQHAFDNTELTPPESVWEKIELGLNPENTPPSKPNFGNKPYYFLGVIVISLLGLFIWFNKDEGKRQVTEKQEVKIEKTVVQNKSNISEKIVRVVGGDTNHGAEKLPIMVSEKSKEIILFTETPIVEPKENNEETHVRTLTDSVEMIEPLATKSIHSEIENPMTNLPTDQTPYYIKPLPKPQKKSIFKNVKFSSSMGVY